MSFSSTACRVASARIASPAKSRGVYFMLRVKFNSECLVWGVYKLESIYIKSFAEHGVICNHYGVRFIYHHYGARDIYNRYGARETSFCATKCFLVGHLVLYFLFNHLTQ
jgi:hypothetical protein